MSLVPVRELRNHTADVIERARQGEEVTITSNGVAIATLVPISATKRPFLTKDEFIRLTRQPKDPVADYYDDEEDDETTDDLGPIQ
ncbi:type II toxin-antitoxin system prevent-host-death family antitoxin [Cryobacterium sp. PH31-O1]|uniref:type II toxin-antitoxin system Phd/YefM family antitoxin n=1 Tax=Cryobacterium sp. PH31-O1 TaxID=3046306 RepID=UPI0024BBB8E0|nr:type II toxin-antitoxin system prevent-host-death family antitoxin [Cryobacterium sp. PH31-O1]MDJ0337597.1 type II toxin-antitoxin system prevent-host-death family antitoxin [Cryobacterium sp. PH31-O1]